MDDEPSSSPGVTSPDAAQQDGADSSEQDEGVSNVPSPDTIQATESRQSFIRRPDSYREASGRGSPYIEPDDPDVIGRADSWQIGRAASFASVALPSTEEPLRNVLQNTSGVRRGNVEMRYVADSQVCCVVLGAVVSMFSKIVARVSCASRARSCGPTK